ncbi:hypothetical protein CEXT_94951 [Caerostris extrusa]|uniref:Uncharacterized protein n=1 Tax=Caerostris extrusa TaxID=172846 RepID=A0AAV4VNZ5_CAEEX|nr:hypothetical protein CEXT_94951 [Caerostris extrusa]
MPPRVRIARRNVTSSEHAESQVKCVYVGFVKIDLNCLLAFRFPKYCAGKSREQVERFLPVRFSPHPGFSLTLGSKARPKLIFLPSSPD